MPHSTSLKFQLPCIIFAGGKSSRMGRDKALLPFGGFDTLCEYQYRRLSPLFASVHLSVKRADGVPFDASTIEDPQGTGVFAPTAGFVAAFKTLDAERIFVLSVDTPFVGENEIAALLAADAPELDAVIARTAGGSHPMCGIYHRSLLGGFEAMLATDSHRLGMLLKSRTTRYVDFDDETRFANLNHPHEYTSACEALRQSGNEEKRPLQGDRSEENSPGNV